MVGELVEQARAELAGAPFAPSPREAHLLLGHTLGLSEAQLLARWKSEVSKERERAFRSLLERRLGGEPVAYLLGRREFFGRSFRVDRRVLIPRPETEHLVEAALALDLPDRPAVLDLGTGSGCIAITLALELEAPTVVGVDLSPAALAVASANARDLGTGTVLRFVGGDLATPLSLHGFDLVVSNPPYVGRDEESRLSPEILDFEPAGALFPPAESASLIRRLVEELEGLDRGAYLLFEFGHRQAEAVRSIVATSAFELVRIHDDYQGIPRVAVARRA